VSSKASWKCIEHLSFFESHVIRAVFQFSGLSYETMEVVGPQMVLTMKMTTFAWNVFDGRRKVEVCLSAFVLWEKKWLKIPFRIWTNGKPQKGSQNTHPYLNSLDIRQSYFLFGVLSPQASIHIIRFYFPGMLVGPHLDFQEYMELINETTFQNSQVKAKVKPGRRLPPGRKRAAYTKMLFGLMYLGVFVLYRGKYNYQVALKPEFMKHSLLVRYV
jgi:lysophospholipid acyltransferase